MLADSLTLLEADATALTTFLRALFRYAEEGSYVTWRAFRDDTKDAPPVFIEASQVIDDGLASLVAAATYYATRAAQHPAPAVFCPPIATFGSAKRAREQDLVNGLALSVECDACPAAARRTLERLLGPATVVVASGGVWTDPESGETAEKLHLHWRLTEPTADPEDHARLKRARILATALVGGDATNVPAVHPIRWPGSWHRKREPRLARIVDHDLDRELDLREALEQLEDAATRTVPLPRAASAAGATAAPVDGVQDTGALVRQILTGEAMHAPLVALAYRYLKGGMSDAQAVLTLRGLMDAVAEPLRNRPDQPDRWAGHYRDIPRTVRTAREKVDAEGGAAPAPAVTPEVRAFAAAHAAPAVIPARRPEPTEIPRELLEPPGILGEIARYDLATAPRPIPIFAVQGALALGSVVCARRYVTSLRNYASCYFLNVAKSGSGKEHAKTTIERILSQAGARRLIGGSSYSSGNAVFSALLRKPQHLAIIDEFGKYLDAASSTRDSFRADALTQLMEAFGRVHGDMATPQFSTLTMSAAAAVDAEPKTIQRPAITLLAMTTPSSFYDAMRSSRVMDGFLNRFLVAEHTGPRVPMVTEWQDQPVPESIVRWVQQILAPHGNLDLGTQRETLPDALLVPLTPSALERANLFERKMLTLADRLERDGLGDMPIRTREIGLRLALIAALAGTPDDSAVTVDVIDWAFAYAEFFLHQTVAALRDRVADSQTERARNAILQAIRAAGERGITNRELNRGKAFLAIPKRERMEAIDSLVAAELVAWTQLPAGAAGGRPRYALIALDEAESGGDEVSVVPSVQLSA